MASSANATAASNGLQQSMTTPIYATLVSSAYVFSVRCEATKQWLCASYGTRSYGPGKEQEAWLETLKKSEGQFYKAEKVGETLKITFPTGYWLRDGRLVAPRYTGGEREQAYFGTESEILSRRKIVYITDGPYTFLPDHLKNKVIEIS